MSVIISPTALRGYGRGYTFQVRIVGASGTIDWYVYKALTKESAFATLLAQEKVLHNYRSVHFEAPEVDHLDQDNQEQLYAALAFSSRPKPYTKTWLLKRLDREYEPATFLGQVGKAHLDPEHEIKLTRISQLPWVGYSFPPSGYDDAGLYPENGIPEALRTYLDRTLYPVAIINPSDGGEFLYDDPLYGRITYVLRRPPAVPLPYNVETYLLYLCLYDRPRATDLVAVLEHGLNEAVASMLWGLREYGDPDAVSSLVWEDAQQRAPAHPPTKFDWFFFKLRRKPDLPSPPNHPRALVNGLTDNASHYNSEWLEDLINRGFLDINELQKLFPPHRSSVVYGSWNGLHYFKLVRDHATGKIHLERVESTPTGAYVLLHRDGQHIKVLKNVHEARKRALELYRQGFLKAVPASWLLKQQDRAPFISRTFFV